MSGGENAVLLKPGPRTPLQEGTTFIWRNYQYFDKHLGVGGETDRKSATEPLGKVASEKKLCFALESEGDDTERRREVGRELRVSPLAQTVKNPPAMQETWVRSLGWENPLEEAMATHSRILAWRIPWPEEPGRLQPTGSEESATTA